MAELFEHRCRCDMPDRWVSQANCPVEFDERMNEYHLVHDGQQWIMRYCFWCGGRLPESKRSTFFTKVAPAEVEKIRTLLTGARTVDDVIRVLGEPDERLECRGGIQPGQGEYIPYRQTLRYSTRWKTVVLNVHEFPDGRIAKSWHGHHVPDPQQAPLRRWWQFWK